MSRIKYRVSDEQGKEIFVGDSAEVREHFNLSAFSNLNQYLTLDSRIQGKYYVEKISETNAKYEELLAKQIFLFREYDTVVGYSKDIQMNVRDLAERGIKVTPVPTVMQGKKKSKYYILKKEVA